MGIYVNPEEGTKEEWLEKNGVKVYGSGCSDWSVFFSDFNKETMLPVVLLHNPCFTAAGIAYDEREFEACMEPDGRKKEVYAVPKRYLMEVTGGCLENYLKGG